MANSELTRFGLPEADPESFRGRVSAVAMLPVSERASFSLEKELVRSDAGGFVYPDGAAMRIVNHGQVECWRRIDQEQPGYLGDDWRSEAGNA